MVRSQASKEKNLQAVHHLQVQALKTNQNETVPQNYKIKLSFRINSITIYNMKNNQLHYLFYFSLLLSTNKTQFCKRIFVCNARLISIIMRVWSAFSNITVEMPTSKIERTQHNQPFLNREIYMISLLGISILPPRNC